jgi:hypothetical protein
VFVWMSAGPHAQVFARPVMRIAERDRHEVRARSRFPLDVMNLCRRL